MAKLDWYSEVFDDHDYIDHNGDDICPECGAVILQENDGADRDNNRSISISICECEVAI